MPPSIKNAAATREKMLHSARHHFLQESYDNVGLRDIARDAGVDVALVSRYFGSKEGLFKEVLRGKRPSLAESDLKADDLPAYFASLSTQDQCGSEQENIDRLLIILRSASSPKAAAVVRDAMREDMLEPIARMLPGEDADVRASLLLSVLMGTGILRTVMAVEPLCQCDTGTMHDRLLALLKAAIAEQPGCGAA
jgi:AcrR family transcriptional regulator